MILNMDVAGNNILKDWYLINSTLSAYLYYSKLISRFKGADYKGSGMSIGIDRLLYALNQLENIKIDTKQPVLVCVLDQKYIQQYHLNITKML